MVTFSLLSPRKMITRQWYHLLDEFQSCHVDFKARFDAAVVADLSKAQNIDGLELPDLERIWPALYDAAYCYHALNWWPIFKKVLRDHLRVLMISILLAVGLAAATVVWFLPFPSAPGLSGVAILRAIVAAEFILILGDALHSRLLPVRSTFLIVIETAAAFVAVYQFKRWSSYPQPAWRQLVHSFPFLHYRLRVEMAATSVAPLLELTLWFVVIMCTLILALRLVKWNVKLIIGPLEPGNSYAAEKCAEVIIDLVRISHFISKLARDLKTDSDSHKPVYYPSLSGTAIWKRIPSPRQRAELDGMLNSLAILVRHRWKQALASSHGIGGQWVSGYAPNIEFFIRRQQARNMLMGNNLLELRAAMTSAMVQAADSNWHMIGGGDENAAVAIAARWKRALRRAVAIGTPLVAAITASRLSKDLPSGYSQAIVVMCFGAAGVQLLGLIDPDSPARLEVASKITSLFRRG